MISGVWPMPRAPILYSEHAILMLNRQGFFTHRLGAFPRFLGCGHRRCSSSRSSGRRTGRSSLQGSSLCWHPSSASPALRTWLPYPHHGRRKSEERRLHACLPSVASPLPSSHSIPSHPFPFPPASLPHFSSPLRHPISSRTPLSPSCSFRYHSPRKLSPLLGLKRVLTPLNRRRLGRNETRDWRTAAKERLEELGGLNTSQRKAIASALTRSLSLWQGPPGTGKTRTMMTFIDVLCHACNARLEWRQSIGQILVVADTNAAVDNLLEVPWGLARTAAGAFMCS